MRSTTITLRRFELNTPNYERRVALNGAIQATIVATREGTTAWSTAVPRVRWANGGGPSEAFPTAITIPAGGGAANSGNAIDTAARDELVIDNTAAEGSEVFCSLMVTLYWEA